MLTTCLHTHKTQGKYTAPTCYRSRRQFMTDIKHLCYCLYDIFGFKEHPIWLLYDLLSLLHSKLKQRQKPVRDTATEKVKFWVKLYLQSFKVEIKDNLLAYIKCIYFFVSYFQHDYRLNNIRIML